MHHLPFDQDTAFPFRDAALYWYHQGFAVIPIAKGTKNPPFDYKSNPERTRDLRTINIWRDTYPDAGIAIMPGRTGHVVLDIDNKGGTDKHGKPKPNGFEALAELDLTLSSLPNTLQLVSGSGKGAHLVFSGGSVGLHRLQWHPGLDVMAGPQAILVVAPTVHPSGGRYRVAAQLPVARLPGDWVSAIGDNTRQGIKLAGPITYHDDRNTVRSCARWLKNRDGAVEGSGGDQWTFKTICCLRDKGVSQEVALRLLKPWNERCEPPWDEAELAGKVANAYEYAKNDPGVAHPANEFGLELPEQPEATEADYEEAPTADGPWQPVPEADIVAQLAIANPLPAILPPLEVVRAVLSHGQCYEGKDKLKPTPVSLRAIFDHDPVWPGLMCRNVRTAGKEYTRQPPFPVVDLDAINDLDLLGAQRYIWDRWGCLFDKSELRDALDLGISQTPKDHVKDYVLGLPTWDGKPRVGTFFEMYAGADGKPWQEEAAKVWFCGSIARALTPGCKFDHMLILQGYQGIGKSSLLAALYDGPRGGYSDAVIDFNQAPQSWVPTICSAWCHEAGEMVSMSTADNNKIKNIITIRHHTVTLKYDRNASRLAVGYVMTASTNEQNILRDATGSRRYIVIKCHAVDVASIRRDREQLWAEALHLLNAGQKIWMDGDHKAASEEHNAGIATFIDHPWYSKLAALAAGTMTLEADVMRGPEHFKFVAGSGCEEKISAGRLYSALGIDGIQGNLGHTAALRGILASLGYDPRQQSLKVDGKVARGWRKV
jgi:hypothetical protein